MARLYITPTQLNSYPVALAFAFQIAQLQALTGAVDQLLARASERVDAYCRKRIGAPGVTTVGTGGIVAGGTALPVASTLGFDDDAEQAVQIGTGGVQEIVPILPGGVQVTSWVAPYPGTITLAQGTMYAHSAGETVQGCYQEVSVVGSSASLDTYSESLLALNQAAQIARAHAPQFNTSNLVRVIFLKCYPIVSLLKLEHMLPIDTVYGTVDSTNVGIENTAGFLRLPLGSFVLPDGLFRSTYTAGYLTIPPKVQAATAWYAADELQKVVSLGAYEMQMGGQKGKYQLAGKSLYEQSAEALLDKGFRRRT